MTTTTEEKQMANAGAETSPRCAQVTGSPSVKRSRVHMCLCISGALKNMSDRQLRGLFTRDDGTAPTAREARDYLRLEQAKGREVLPIGDCDNFDYKTGCRGHEYQENTEASNARERGRNNEKS
jgi:hypothetical protein